MRCSALPVRRKGAVMAKREDDEPIDRASDGPVPDVAPEPQAEPEPEPSAVPEPASQAPEQPAEQWNDIRDYARANGLDLSHIADSEQAAKYLVDMARNNSAYAQYGQQLAPYYSDIQRYLASRGQQQQAPQQPQGPKNYFGLPDYDPSWLDWLERDAAGNVVPKVGAPPDIVSKVVQYQKAAQQFQTQFWQKPQQYLEPLIRDSVTPLVQQAIQQNLQNYQSQVFATNFLAQNTNWLHYHDQQGQVLRDPVTGGYALTPEGQLFVAHLKRAESMGVGNIQAQQQYAMDQMRLAYFAQQQAQQQGVAN